MERAKGTHIFVFWYETIASFRFEHEDLYDLPCLRMRSWQSHWKADGELLVGRSLTRKFWVLRKGHLLKNEIFKDECVPFFFLAYILPIHLRLLYAIIAIICSLSTLNRHGRNNFFFRKNLKALVFKWEGRGKFVIAIEIRPCRVPWPCLTPTKVWAWGRGV